MTNKSFHHSRALSGASLLMALVVLATASPAALAQQEQGRVISSTPIRTPDGIAGYSVTYEYAGRQYSTRTDQPPGDSIPLQITPMGVMNPQAPDQAPDQAPVDNADSGGQQWRNVRPEPGVVVSGSGAAASYPATTYPYPVATYPAPVYVAPQPVYVAPGYGYGYGYGYPYVSPIGLSLNFGYSRGWRR